MIVSVPSFGDSFFIAGNNPDLDNEYDEFPSPHSGILFLLIVLQKAIRKARHSFRPLIRGFFFYKAVALGDGRYAVLAFPSPHSGILFLSCRYDMPPSLNIFAIFRRLLHLL